MTTHRTRRGGFTIIELLVVIAILTMLAAITAGAVTRVRTAQMSRNSEQTVTKLQLALDQQWKAMADRVNEDRNKRRIPEKVMSECGNDIDKAAAFWMYIQARREFPQSFSEATNPINFPGWYTPDLPFVQPRKTFASVSGSLSAEEEGAVLLYLILSEKGDGGVRFNADDATQGAQGTVGGFKVFVDAWQKPITFVRHAKTGELDAPPYIRSGASHRDPLDPTGKLKTMLDGNGMLKGIWPNQFRELPDNTNRQITAISAGPNQNWDGVYDMDNIVGYRLRTQGARGD